MEEGSLHLETSSLLDRPPSTRLDQSALSLLPLGNPCPASFLRSPSSSFPFPSCLLRSLCNSCPGAKPSVKPRVKTLLLYDVFFIQAQNEGNVRGRPLPMNLTPPFLRWEERSGKSSIYLGSVLSLPSFPPTTTTTPRRLQKETTSSSSLLPSSSSSSSSPALLPSRPCLLSRTTKPISPTSLPPSKLPSRLPSYTMQHPWMDLEPNHPLPSTFPLAILNPPLRSPLRPPSKQPIILCSLPTPPATPSPSPTPSLLDNIDLPSTSSPPAVIHGGEAREPNRATLDVDDRAEMDALMSLSCSKEHCDMASEVIGIIVQATPAGSDATIMERIEASTKQAQKLSRALESWCDLAPHPLCSLISTVILFERLFARYPKISEAAVASDTYLRLTFASFLVATKTTCDSNFFNASFAPYTYWSLHDINTMERELMKCLDFDVYISSSEFLHRATGFWTRHLLLLESTRPSSSSSPSNLFSIETSTSSVCLSSSSNSSSSPLPIGNLFLTQRREGVKERGWKGGIVRTSSVMGRRMSSVDGEEETVWRDGRLERSEEWSRFRSSPGLKRGGSSKESEGEVSRRASI